MLRKVEEVERREADVLGVQRLERQTEVEGSWRGGVEGLKRVMGEMPGVVARCERAGKAERYVVGMEK